MANKTNKTKQNIQKQIYTSFPLLPDLIRNKNSESQKPKNLHIYCKVDTFGRSC